MNDRLYTVADVSVNPPTVHLRMTAPGGQIIRLRMTEKVWESWSLTKGSSVLEETFLELRADSEKCEAITKALSYLSSSSYSLKELMIKLRRAGFSEEASRIAANTVLSRGLVHEREQACRMAEREAISKRRGPARIRQSLLAHGYRSSDAEAAIQSIPPEVFEDALEAEFARRCPGGVPEDDAERRKLTAALSRQGFGITAILKCFERHE